MNNKLNLTSQEFIYEINSAITKSDRKLARELLPHIPELDDATINRCLFEISTAPDNDSYFMLSYLVKLKTLKEELHDEIVDLILDKASLNSHFAILFIEHADRKKLKEAVPLFANILVNETDTHVLFEIIKAVGSTKEPSCVDVIAEFIFYDNDELKTAAVEALEKIGGPSVIKRLAFASTTSKSDQQILDTLDRLQSSLSLDNIEGSLTPANQFASRNDTLQCLSDDSDVLQLLTMLNSSSPHDRHSAIDLLIDTGVKGIPAVAENINMDDPDSIINGLDILGNINHSASHAPVLKILNSNHKDSNVRFAAYEAISKLPPTDSSISLINGIEDSSEQVRIAAATAIDKNLSKILIAGLTGKIETFGKQSNQKIIISAILDSCSANIFSSLLGSDSFVFIASEYLTKAHDLTFDFFIELLNKRGTKTLAQDIRDNKKIKNIPKTLTIYIVDDSEIMLRFYIKYFHIMGNMPYVFSDPEEALAAIEEVKPDVITSDLNMLSMNGLQFTTRIRQTYNSRELPVIIITTQTDFVESASSAGAIMPDGNIPTDSYINQVLLKPPETSQLKPILEVIGKSK